VIRRRGLDPSPTYMARLGPIILRKIEKERKGLLGYIPAQQIRLGWA